MATAPSLNASAYAPPSHLILSSDSSHSTRNAIGAGSFAWPNLSTVAAAFFNVTSDAIYCPTQGDLFIDAPHQAELRQQLWAQIEARPDRMYVLLTRNPQNVLRMIPQTAAWRTENGSFPDNVWIGGLVESQRAADTVIPALLQLPARRFLYHPPLVSAIPYLLNGTYRHSDAGNDLLQCTSCGAGVWEEETHCSNCQGQDKEEWTAADMLGWVIMPVVADAGSELQVYWQEMLRDDYRRVSISVS